MKETLRRLRVLFAAGHSWSWRSSVSVGGPCHHHVRLYFHTGRLLHCQSNSTGGNARGPAVFVDRTHLLRFGHRGAELLFTDRDDDLA
jgi:hypothetical protein